jgi:hypothetical protein
MRLLELKQLTEGKTIAQSIEKVPARAQFFFNNIEQGIGFPVEPSKKDPNPADLVVDKKQLPELKRAYKAGSMSGIMLQGTDGRKININSLVKTQGFGTKEAEKIPVKPSSLWGIKGQEDIDPTQQNVSLAELKNLGAFPLKDLNQKIQENTALDQTGNIGKAIKEIAQQIEDGNVPVIPSYLKPAEIKAIELYASEYLGILSLYKGVAEFNNKADFDKFLGSNLGELMLYFPYSTTNQLGDSFAVKNRETGHTLIMSSKAGSKGGAAPAVSGLRIPDYLRKDKKFAKEVEFLDLCQESRISGKTQPFALMNWLFENAPETIPEAFYPYLPWTQEWVDAIVEGISTKDKFPAADMKVFINATAKGRSQAATDAGVIWYATISNVLKAINQNNALPNINAAVLETLGYNFLQVYTKIVGNKLTTKIFWPAKITGSVNFESKAGATEPGKAKISFRVSPT